MRLECNVIATCLVRQGLLFCYGLLRLTWPHHIITAGKPSSQLASSGPLRNLTVCRCLASASFGLQVCSLELGWFGCNAGISNHKLDYESAWFVRTIRQPCEGPGGAADGLHSATCNIANFSLVSPIFLSTGRSKSFLRPRSFN